MERAEEAYRQAIQEGDVIDSDARWVENVRYTFMQAFLDLVGTLGIAVARNPRVTTMLAGMFLPESN